MKIGIIGRKKQTLAYEKYLDTLHIPHITTLTTGSLSACHGIILPGGGDISPDLYGESNQGSFNIDIELDLLQLRAFYLAFQQQIPILGICKGMQLINVALGGTLFQDIKTASFHTSKSQDVYHDSLILTPSFLYSLYGEKCLINSRHHQTVHKLGQELLPIQWCPYDNHIEAIIHKNLPVFGVQWHPERLNPLSTDINGLPLLQYFLSFV